MRFSLKSLLLASTWTAWLFGALVGSLSWVSESFVACQYFLLAVSASIAILADREKRLFAICFSVGFLSWLLFLLVEVQCASIQSFSYSIAGSRIAAVSDWICGFASFSNSNAQALVEQNKAIAAVLRAAIGTVSGVLTYLGVVFLSTASRNEHKVET